MMLTLANVPYHEVCIGKMAIAAFGKMPGLDSQQRIGSSLLVCIAGNGAPSCNAVRHKHSTVRVVCASSSQPFCHSNTSL